MQDWEPEHKMEEAPKHIKLNISVQRQEVTSHQNWKGKM